MARGYPDWQRNPRTTLDLVTEIPADPGAGNDYSVTVVAPERWRLISVQFDLLTDATVANRLVVVSVNRSGRAVLTLSGPAVQPASQTGIYTLGAFLGAFNVVGASPGRYYASPLPEWWLLPADTLRVAAEQFQAADLFRNIAVMYERITV